MYITGSLVSVLASSAVNHGFEPPSGQTKDYAIGIHCFPKIKSLKLKEQSLAGPESG